MGFVAHKYGAVDLRDSHCGGSSWRYYRGAWRQTRIETRDLVSQFKVDVCIVCRTAHRNFEVISGERAILNDPLLVNHDDQFLPGHIVQLNHVFMWPFEYANTASLA